ncbi:MAG: ABC transporter substrate-binding protein [Burkholderiales bacterium]
MKRITISLLSAVCVLAFVASSALAQQVLRIAMTTADVPTTTGAPNQGLEGFRFAGFPAFEPLVHWDLRVASGVPPAVPWLARTFESDPADRKRWIFTLREGVRFHDGSEVTADAVVWNLERFFNTNAPHYEKNAAALARVWLAAIDKWERLDKYRIAITTKDPTSFFPEVMTNLLIASPAGYEAAGRDWQKFSAAPSGTGPFRITKVTRNSIEMDKNAAYWNPERAAKVDRVILLPMAEATTRLAALRSGQVDWIEVPPPDSVPSLKAAGFTVVAGAFPHIWPYWLKTTDESPFKDVRVRQAFNYAIDRASILALLNGIGEPASGFWKKGDPRFGNPKNDYKYDPAKAKALLAEAGYKTGDPVKVRAMISTSGSGQMLPLPMNEVLQQNARAAGFDIQFVVVEWGQLIQNTRVNPNSPQMQGVTAVNSSLTTADMNWFFRSFYPPNWAGWDHPEAKKLMEDYRVEFNAERRLAIQRRLHELLVDEAPWAWILHDTNPRAFTKRVKGYVPVQSWFTDLTRISME